MSAAIPIDTDDFTLLGVYGHVLLKFSPKEQACIKQWDIFRWNYRNQLACYFLKIRKRFEGGIYGWKGIFMQNRACFGQDVFLEKKDDFVSFPPRKCLRIDYDRGIFNFDLN